MLALSVCFSACNKKQKDSQQATQAPTQQQEGTNKEPQKEPCTKEMKYKLNADGESYALVSVGECTCENVTVPETYKGLPVTSIGTAQAGQAFRNCLTLKSIVIPSSIKEIYASSFASCANLEKVVLPSTLTGIGARAFYGCNALKTITIPSGVEYIGENAFASCKELTINCEHAAAPSEWHINWNSSDCPVVWGYNG